MARSVRVLDCVAFALMAVFVSVCFVSYASAQIFPTGSFGFSHLIYTAEIDAGYLEWEDDDDIDGIFDDDDDDDGLTSDSTASAVCEIFINTTPKLITCNVAHGSGTATSVELWLGKPKVKEELVGTFIQAAEGTMPFYFTATVIVPDNLVERLLDGEMFLQFTAPLYPQGEMRGQLLRTNRLYALLDAANVRPSVSSTVVSHGIFLANYTIFQNPWDFKSPGDQTLAIQVDHTVGGSDLAQIFRGGTGQSSTDVIATLSESRSQIRQWVNITASIARDIFNQQTYFEINSNAFGNGEVRGQLYGVDPIPPVTHTARMDHTQTVPPYVPAAGENPRGCAILTVDCDALRIEYLVVHNVEDAVLAVAGQGQRGEAGLVLFDLARPQSPIYGSHLLAPSERSLLFVQQIYFEVYAVGRADPVLRGQIERDNDYFAYLTGTQMIPPVTTAAVGCASFDLRPDRVVDYDIVHTVKNPSAVGLYHGKIGQTQTLGEINALFSTYKSPMRGSDVQLSPLDRTRFREERMFLKVHSADYPNGELRGQVLRLLTASCDNSLGDPAPDPFFPPDAPSDGQFGIASLVPAADQMNNTMRGSGSALLPSAVVAIVMLLAAFL